MATSKTAVTMGKAATKSEIYQELGKETELSKKQVAAFFDALTAIIKREVGKKGPGVFALPGLLKIKKVHKKATPAREGTKPGTNEKITIKAKPARNVVKVLALKNLKEMVK